MPPSSHRLFSISTHNPTYASSKRIHSVVTQQIGGVLESLVSALTSFVIVIVLIIAVEHNAAKARE
ncbi:hypothetical protein K458DRAFT_417248 [Lentithecium fluviatile CBS 122367]|uniref:Uncharacterized protein n=1 Tax=Lentithecium fluviatile CBS 122367 TaxID=1168545 RepID=A0A6G1J3T3_9PLEO|nr:hypothetical protein K458DRAFT_417248 [Lentithecium fluviatile CBS 122367]